MGAKQSKEEVVEMGALSPNGEPTETTSKS